MNLLSYTKKLYEKINSYDKIFKQQNFSRFSSNPFAQQETITVIWVENNNGQK